MEDGSLWFQGRYPSGTSAENSPNWKLTKIADNVISAACGNDHCGYVTADGSLYMWGSNIDGQIGDGTKETCKEPKKMMDDVLSVSMCVDNTVVLKRDGSVWEWQHVNKQYDKPRVPTRVMDGAIYADAGAYHSVAIKADNSLWAWGLNERGELGNGEYGTGKRSDVPVKVMDNVVYAEADWYTTAALKKDGSLWLWGHEFEHAYDPDAVPISKPKKILDDAAGFSLDGQSIFCIKNDGSVLFMGFQGPGNRFAASGLGTDETIKVPTPIGFKVRLPGFIALPGKTPFEDVPMGYPHEDAIKWASENNIITGYNKIFRPEDSLTEAEFVVMLTKYGRIPYDETYTGSHYSDKFYKALAPYNLPLKGYTDASAKVTPIKRGEIAQIIAAVFGLEYDMEEAIMFMYANNFSAGMSTTERTVETYGRDHTFTRAAAAAFLNKMSAVTSVVDGKGGTVSVMNREIKGIK